MPTLVVLMGLHALPEIARKLVAHGARAEAPAAVIASGTLPTQQVVVGTLATIAALASEAGLEPPATVVVGEVVQVRGGYGGATDGQGERLPDASDMGRPVVGQEDGSVLAQGAPAASLLW
jgi:siroheme synthase